MKICQKLWMVKGFRSWKKVKISINFVFSNGPHQHIFFEPTQPTDQTELARRSLPIGRLWDGHLLHCHARLFTELSIQKAIPSQACLSAVSVSRTHSHYYFRSVGVVCLFCLLFVNFFFSFHISSLYSPSALPRRSRLRSASLVAVTFETLRRLSSCRLIHHTCGFNPSSSIPSPNFTSFSSSHLWFVPTLGTDNDSENSDHL